MNINNAVDKEYEGKSLKELLDAPVGALQGLSDAKGKMLEEALNVKTIGDLASCKYFLWAKSIQILSATEE